MIVYLKSRVILELTRCEIVTIHVGQEMELSPKDELRTKMQFDRSLMKLSLKYKI
jgi:hypothetical protein